MRSGPEYDEVAKEIIQIYIDYDIISFPLKLKKICSKLGVSLVPYSKYTDDEVDLLNKRSSKGFFVRGTCEREARIYYNDLGITKEEMRFTIAHELKHYVDNENEEDLDSDDLADYFARYFLCPVPYLIVKGIVEPNDIAIHCKVSPAAASYASSNIKNRMKWYGSKLFDYELPLIKLLAPEEYHVYQRAQ